jgi:hypothetical protein
MKNILILTFIFFCISAYSQEVEIIAQNSKFIPRVKVERFDFIDNNFNLANQTKIAILKGYSINSETNNLVGLFNLFWEISNRLGANTYLVDKVERVSDTVYVRISIYYLDNTALDDIYVLYPKNRVYIFGDLDAKKGKTKIIKLNGQKIAISPLEYIEYQNLIGKYASISIGGSLGSKVDIYGEEERLPVCLSLNGFKVGIGINNSISLRFNTGSIYRVEMNFGYFLTSILTLKKY